MVRNEAQKSKGQASQGTHPRSICFQLFSMRIFCVALNIGPGGFISEAVEFFTLQLSTRAITLAVKFCLRERYSFSLKIGEEVLTTLLNCKMDVLP